MNISDDRLNHFAHLLVDELYNDDLMDYTDDDDTAALRIARQVLAGWKRQQEEITEAAAEKVRSLKRGVVEGTPEWDILVKKYYEEEANRRGN